MVKILIDCGFFFETLDPAMLRVIILLRTFRSLALMNCGSWGAGIGNGGGDTDGCGGCVSFMDGVGDVGESGGVGVQGRPRQSRRVGEAGCSDSGVSNGGIEDADSDEGDVTVGDEAGDLFDDADKSGGVVVGSGCFPCIAPTRSPKTWNSGVFTSNFADWSIIMEILAVWS